MTRPITTAPADTARAMHAAEMRGSDMQEVCTLEIKHHGVGAYEVVRHDPVVTEAECQLRIDAAVLAEREAAKSLVWTLGHEIRAAMLVDEDNEQTVLDMVKSTAAAIRARGQK